MTKHDKCIAFYVFYFDTSAHKAYLLTTSCAKIFINVIVCFAYSVLFLEIGT